MLVKKSRVLNGNVIFRRFKIDDQQEFDPCSVCPLYKSSCCTAFTHSHCTFYNIVIGPGVNSKYFYNVS